jgi:class 3 adenylate cyclase
MEDLEKLTMTEIIRLQDQLSQVLKRRFEKNLALAFSDIVNSTPYFARFGNEAGRGLQQRHVDLLQKVLPAAEGRIVDTAGDGAFTCFPHVEKAAAALIELQKLISNDNLSRPREHQLGVRIGMHWGAVLTDGQQVTGDAVNLCARVATSAQGGEIRITREAFLEIQTLQVRLMCQAVPSVELKGINRHVEVLTIDWRDRSLFPTSVVVAETNEEITLPDQDIITFGRLKQNHGVQANDVVLAHPDPVVTAQISRWHFELRRHADGYVLRPVSDQVTEVDGAPVPKGQDVRIGPGTTVRLAKALTLTFQSPTPFEESSSTQISRF